MDETTDEGSECDRCPHTLSLHELEITREKTVMTCSVKRCDCEAEVKMKGWE